MKQRKIQDGDNTIWDCVEAFSGMSKENARKAEAIVEDDNTVDVICTPSGGAQSVRLQLEKNWLEDMADEKIIQAIQAHR